MIQRPGRFSELRKHLRNLYKRFFELMAVAGGNNKHIVPSSLAGKPTKSIVGAKLQGLRAKFSSTHAIRLPWTHICLNSRIMLSQIIGKKLHPAGLHQHRILKVTLSQRD